MTENLQADQSFWDEVDEAAETADSGGAQFGQLTIKPSRFIHWVDSAPVDVTPAEFSKLPAKDKSLELMFSIDVQGMNPDLEWTYERKIRPGEKDWHKILKPSIVALKGEDSMKKGEYSKTLQELSGTYVEAADVPQSKNLEFNTIKLVALFDSKEECFAAYQARFGEGGDGGTAVPASAPLSFPKSYTAESWAEMTPHIKAELASGKTPPDVAANYKVDLSFIAEIAAQA